MPPVILSSTDVEQVQKRFDALMQERQQWMTTGQDIQRYIAPKRGFFSGQTNDSKGQKIDHKLILNNVGMTSLRTLASGIHSGLTSPSRPWFRIGIADKELAKDEEVKLWLQAVQESMYTVFAGSNIYSELWRVYEELGSFATGLMYLEPDYDTVVRASNMTFGQYALGVGESGKVNTLARAFTLNALQMVEKFGEDNLSPVAKENYKRNNTQAEHVICHLVEPNDDRIEGKSDTKNMPWRSLYWEKSNNDNKYLRVSGYESFRFLAPRWQRTTTNTPYGNGPGWEALGPVRGIQQLERLKYLIIDKIANPAMNIPSSLKNAEVSTLPGGVNYVNETGPDQGIRPVYQIAPQVIQYLQNVIDREVEGVKHTMYTDLFATLMDLDRPEMTAREVVERHQESLRLLGPAIENLESELLSPLIDLVFEIMLDSNLIPPAPEVLSEMPLKVEYISILAQAQKMVQTTSSEQFLRFVSSAATVKPDVLDVADFDRIVRDYAEWLGIPVDSLNSDEVVEAARRGREAAQQQQQQQQQEAAAVAGAKTLSETPVDTNSALTALMNGQVGIPTGTKQ